MSSVGFSLVELSLVKYQEKKMSKTIFLEIFGEPVAQGRPKAFRRGNHIGMYDPKKSSTWKDSIKMQAIAQKAQMLSGALYMQTTFYLARPKSLPKKVVYHVKKPDVSNLIKAVEDALKGICYHDDSQIVKSVIQKEYNSLRPGVIITLSELE